MFLGCQTCLTCHSNLTEFKIAKVQDIIKMLLNQFILLDNSSRNKKEENRENLPSRDEIELYSTQSLNH